MKTFADLKRSLTVGKTLTMIRNDWYPVGGIIGIPRKIKTVQSNGIQFEPHKEGSQGSWMHWDGKKASDFKFTENGFMVALEPDFSKSMEYIFN